MCMLCTCDLNAWPCLESSYLIIFLKDFSHSDGIDDCVTDKILAFLN
ncbi:hypothetical protein HanXRQr2_Chr15g0673621 [Helianthus annuus]|uniref:Uncharacterized protein n=1 Tax=Helianthus annuus TaxID=4232 RepID=A0A9K3H2Z9_HELAN|nr:hypothetical protein HanXRQr2_Chr15g0673621 [Helianthus annuus]